MSGDLIFRPTIPGDEDFLWLVLFYASHSNDEPGVMPEDIRLDGDLTGYITGWKEAGHPGVVATEGGVPVGAAWLRVLKGAAALDPVFVDEDTPELAVAVLPGEESRGIGSAMLDALLATAGSTYRAIVLSTRSTSPAIGLYERFGFEVVGTIRNRVGTESVKMLRVGKRPHSGGRVRA